MLPARDSLQLYEHTQVQSEGVEKYIPCNWKPKENRGIIKISDKIGFKSKAVIRDKVFI